MGEVTFKGVFFEENCPEASIPGGNCPGVFLEGNFLRKQLYRGKAIFIGSNCPGVGQISSGATSFVSNRAIVIGGNHLGDLSAGELLVGVTFLGDNFPGDDYQGANCLATTSPGGDDPETVINTVGPNIFFVI